MHEIFEHTADLGLRIRAADLNALFCEAAEAMFAMIVANPEAVEAVEAVSLAVAAERTDDLLRDWLAELLFTFDSRHLVLNHFAVQVSETSLTATARGEVFDPERHEPRMEIKAITYHGLKLEKTPDGWLAEVIVDI
jgi:SHS2 domain-containing protein